MVGTINDSLLKSLLHSQTNASGGTRSDAALKPNKKAAQAIIDQLQQTSEQGKALMKQSASVSSLTAAPNRNLPRGSLVDLLV